VEGIPTAEEMPEWLHGPYSEERAREHDVPGIVLGFHLHAERPSSLVGRLDSADSYFDPRDRATARRGFVQWWEEYSWVLLLEEWQPAGVRAGRDAPVAPRARGVW
jgi:hypothetical protein